jgi:hypothetical protein
MDDIFWDGPDKGEKLLKPGLAVGGSDSNWHPYSSLDALKENGQDRISPTPALTMSADEMAAANPMAEILAMDQSQELANTDGNARRLRAVPRNAR